MKKGNQKNFLPSLGEGLGMGLVVLSLFACGGGKETKSETVKADSTANDKTKTVEIISLVPQLFNNYIDIQGRIDADENVAVNAEMPGTISKVNVHLGDEVSTGQTLAELDSKMIQQGIAELQNGLDLATTYSTSKKICGNKKSEQRCNFFMQKIKKNLWRKKWQHFRSN